MFMSGPLTLSPQRANTFTLVSPFVNISLIIKIGEACDRGLVRNQCLLTFGIPNAGSNLESKIVYN